MVSKHSERHQNNEMFAGRRIEESIGIERQTRICSDTGNDESGYMDVTLTGFMVYHK